MYIYVYMYRLYIGTMLLGPLIADARPLSFQEVLTGAQVRFTAASPRVGAVSSSGSSNFIGQ